MLVATAGHVDHGKTSLIQNLTGTNTDRLAEEKQRGLSIELGYAFHNAGTSEPIGFIDVPGHHRFINTMISGINGIDLGMLVVAADDGPMPQTLEHLQLLRLLGVEHFAGIISKVDLVEPARVDQVVNETRSLIPHAAIYKISNRTGAGIGQLLGFLQAQARASRERPSEQLFRLYIDRVFTKKGAGLVVTGTSLSGTVKAGDDLQLHTSSGDTARKISVRIRGIHAQGASATTAHAGQRCALNLTGKVSTDRVHRGDFLCANFDALPSRRLDSRYWLLDDTERQLKHLGRVKLYIGTRRLSAKTYLLDRSLDDVASGKRPGQRVQLILDKGVLAFAGDRFVIRDDNESTTLGGGVVLDPEAPQWGKSRASRLLQLDTLEQGDPKLALEQLLFTHSEIVSLKRVKRIWNLSDTEIEHILATPSLNAEQTMRLTLDNDQIIVGLSLWERYCHDLQQALESWHAARPMEPGIKVDTLDALLRSRIPAQLFKSVLDNRIRAGQVIISDNLAHALGHRPTVSTQVQKDWQRLEIYLTQRGLNLPLRSEIQKDTGLDPRQLEQLTRPALKRAELYPIGEKRLALPATLHELASLVEQQADKPNGFSVIEAKQVFGLGRNLTIEILEFFDAIGYTKRTGTARTISKPDAARQVLRSGKS